MVIKRALIKSLKNNEVLAEGLASIEMVPSSDPDIPRPKVSISVKGIRLDLDGEVCLLWISEKVNGKVILNLSNKGTLASSFLDNDKTEFHVELNEKFAFSDAWSSLRSFPL